MKCGVSCRAIPVYLPVYVFPALLVHRKRLLDPKLAPDIGRRVVQGALRSSLFLSLYCTLAWRGACVGFQWSSELLYLHQPGLESCAIQLLTQHCLSDHTCYPINIELRLAPLYQILSYQAYLGSIGMTDGACECTHVCMVVHHHS